MAYGFETWMLTEKILKLQTAFRNNEKTLLNKQTADRKGNKLDKK